MTKSIRVLVADDNPLLRHGIRVLLDSVNDVKVVGEAEDGKEAIDLVESLSPDIVIMDITMPHLNGLEATEHIHSMGIATKILILTMHKNAAFVRQALRNGARGYVLKRTLTEDLLPAVYRVHEGKRYLSQTLKEPASGDTGADNAGGSPSAE